jgi:hypothetical protein
MTLEYTYTYWEAAEEIDFGDVLVNNPKTLQAQIQNSGETMMTANMSATQPFGVSPATLTMEPGMTTFELTFTPAQSINYTGKLNLEINGQTSSVDMKGVGFNVDDKAVRDSAFYAGITYTWPITTNANTSRLDTIATDPDQIIALLREVYTNPNVPGNRYRGYTTNLQPDETSYCSVNVPYTGAGKIGYSNGNYYFDDAYGWNIPCESAYTGSNNSSLNWCYMDPEEYRPKYDGVTLLLLELQDNFNPNNVSVTATGYDGLRDYVRQTIKSARVITEAKRTGTGAEAGTLFKIDCKQMNKFYLIAKGQLQSHRVLNKALSTMSNITNGYNEPLYLRGSYNYTSYNSYYDPAISHYFMLGHMFEQFSPAISNAEDTKDDIYQELVTGMETFGVVHDCPNVPYIKKPDGTLTGHHFMMYGDDEESWVNQDVVDMMFFVPDYRMMKWENRGYAGFEGYPNYLTQDFFEYNQLHQPTMGMFVILQNAIPEGTIASTTYNADGATGLYKHQLQWNCNLNKFLPSDDQYYELQEVIINDYGFEEYVPVYERNADGSYVMENGHKKPVILDRNSAWVANDYKGNDSLRYVNVYVDMKSGSQTKTYVILGRDKGDANGKPFLTLRMSNRQSIVIPGTDPNEKVRMIGTTHYSRYNAQNETNCYSNKLQIVDNSLTSADLANGLRFTRSYRPARLDENGNVKTDENGNILYEATATSVDFATGTYANGKVEITLSDQYQASKDQFPKPIETGDGYVDVAGYHANNNLTFDVTIKDGKVIFGDDFHFWDNFTADVSKNGHPFQYTYKLYMGTAYSNDVAVNVYKTDSKNNCAILLDDVLGDSQIGEEGDLSAPENVEFQAQVQYGSQSELLRYDAYRWLETDEDRYIVTEVVLNQWGNEEETDVSPSGQADNAGNFYTVRMNSGTDEVYSPDVPVGTSTPRAWATFVDKIPMKTEPRAYVYAPVVETFNFGYKENKENGKWAERKDYNTYGGPIQNVAVGKLEVEVFTPTTNDVDEEHGGDPTLAQMSEYSWFANENWYSYYNIYLKFTALNVPTGYELYKVRAWRQVKNGANILGEELTTRAARAQVGDGWYMCEDINYGDYLGAQKTAQGQLVDRYMSLSDIGPQSGGYLLGHRLTSISKPLNPDGTGGGTVFVADNTPNQNGNDNQYVEQNVRNEMRATFGALRLKDVPPYPGSLDKLEASFKVRAYFTKNTNPLITNPPIQSEQDGQKFGDGKAVLPGSDFDYYIAEGEIDNIEIKSGSVITGIGAVKIDVNREVVGVTYVNPVGQMSSTPWQGVNIVVTRYSDGSTTTKKVIR